MYDKLYWNTVSPLLRNYLEILMEGRQLAEFRLVGGTALSLHLGHRMSVDIDMFTDAKYDSIDFDAIEKFLHSSFLQVEGDFGGRPGMGKSYLVGNSDKELVKLDLYYCIDPFFDSFVEADHIRLASIREIAAMKMDVIQRTGRKKDFWDLHELMDHYTISEMIEFHRFRSAYTHDENLLRRRLIEFEAADEDFDPVCLRGKYWEFIKEDIEEAVMLNQ